MTRALDIAYRLRTAVRKLLRLRTRGVKVMLFDAEGRLVLIRNSYGRTDLFVLPGGGIRPFEAPAAAARREIREELGCAVEELVLLSTHFSSAEGKRDTVHLYKARAVGRPAPRSFEVAETRVFALGTLPPTVSPATRRRIAEFKGERSIDEDW